jgi:molybdopterin-guanine dinucleotide biosynthesis protein A
MTPISGSLDPGLDRDSSTGTGPVPALEQVTGAVLCGGASSRMGEDKAVLDLGGRSLLAHAVACLEPLTKRVVLACGSEPRYTSLGLDVVVDSVRGDGPAVGLEAALAAADTEWLAVLACDMPRVDAALFRRLLREAHARELDICLLATERGPEPLCGVYHRRCLAPLRAALARGERRVTGFHDEQLAPHETHGRGTRLAIGTLDASTERVLNLNTPADLEHERRLRSDKLSGGGEN